MRGALPQVRAAPGAPPRKELAALVRRLRQVPDEHRRFAVDARGARRLHRIGPEVLDALSETGLPRVRVAEEFLYDGYDLGNAALHLGLTSVQSRAIRSWARALETASAADGEVRHRVGVVASCPVPGHPGPCRYGVLLPDGRRPVERPSGEEDRLAELVLRAAPCWPELPSPVRELVHSVDEVGFFLLPEAVRWGPEFLWRTRMADCGGVAEWLVAEGGRRGLTVRFAFGLLVAKPYATPHCWAEFLVDGVWTPVDPLLVRAMAAWGGLDTAVHPPDGSPGAILHRLTGHFTKVVSHGGVWAPTSLQTERMT